MPVDSKQKWNDRYRSPTGPVVASRVLLENQHLLPEKGTALDLACGLGGNAECLARHGLTVSAWDVADNALQSLTERMQGEGLNVETGCRDVETQPPEPNSFDVIVVSYFLHRESTADLVRALKAGGLLFYQTFTQVRVSERGPSNAAFRLQPNELLRLFGELNVLVYREEGQVGDTATGFRDEALLVAQKPA